MAVHDETETTAAEEPLDEAPSEAEIDVDDRLTLSEEGRRMLRFLHDDLGLH